MKTLSFIIWLFLFANLVLNLFYWLYHAMTARMDYYNIWMVRAKWWHFWNPGSGIEGAAIIMTLAAISILL